jgi:hypothetical protein
MQPLLSAFAMDPGLQLEHADDPDSENLPLEHGSHVKDAFFSLNFPAGQGKHCSDPA